MGGIGSAISTTATLPDKIVEAIEDVSFLAVSYTHLDVYKRQEDHVYANHTRALDELSEEAASIPAADICMEQAHDRVAEIRRSRCV